MRPYWWKVRSQFNILDGMTFMNNGTEGPVPRVVVEANEKFFREIAENPSNNYRREEVDVVRGIVAKFVNADPGEIALTRSTTEGMNLFTHGLEWKAGDEVVYCDHEHGGGIGPYTTLAKRIGIKPVIISIPSPPTSVDQIVGLYEKAITPRTKVIMVSHMTYVTGLVTPVKELADLAAAARHPDFGRRRPSARHDGSRSQGDEHPSLRRRGAEMDDVRHRHRRLLRPARRPGSHLAADGAAGRSEGRREEVRGLRPARRALGARHDRRRRDAERDRQEEHRGPRPLPQHAPARRTEADSRA